MEAYLAAIPTLQLQDTHDVLAALHAQPEGSCVVHQARERGTFQWKAAKHSTFDPLVQRWRSTRAYLALQRLPVRLCAASC